ncbi:lysoplasmalogenase TMEM86B-like [Palaemon carinicauda]|uniref:lysoplasmalogenase TMEM86B-like n=1 Tax=Palaemon carinicauda TaxID=392227 RepID=UPI0035B655CA
MKSEKKEKKNRKVTPHELPVYHLLPFALGVIISFVWFLPYKPALLTMSVQRMVLKCLPILYLAVYIMIMDRGRGESLKVFFALIFSLIGDGFLAFHDVGFLYGIVAFGIAHGIYIKTFGFRPMKLLLGGALFALNFFILSFYALPYIRPASFRVGITIYSLVLVTMGWRSLARYFFMTSPCKERRLCSALGGVIFLISDSSYVFLQMLELLPHIPAQIIILSTYYLSQLFFMLGSCESFWGPARNYPKRSS